MMVHEAIEKMMVKYNEMGWQEQKEQYEKVKKFVEQKLKLKGKHQKGYIYYYYKNGNDDLVAMVFDKKHKTIKFAEDVQKHVIFMHCQKRALYRNTVDIKKDENGFYINYVELKMYIERDKRHNKTWNFVKFEKKEGC